MRYAFRFEFAFALAAVVALAVEAACSDDGSSHAEDTSGDAGTAQVPLDARAADSTSDLPMSTMRIAHLAPDLGPIDFCYQGAKKGTFLGPVLGGGIPNDQDAGDAGGDAAGENTPGGDIADAGAEDDADTTDPDAGMGPLRAASYRTVSRYQNLQASGPITIAILAAGATTCASPLATVDVTLDPGKLSTVGVFAKPADGGLAIDVAAFTDDATTKQDSIRVRVIHAALGKTNVPGAGPLAVRAVAAKTTVLADRIDPRHAATASEAVNVDELGYLTAAPIPAPASIAIGPATMVGGANDGGFEPWQSASADLDLRGGSLHTAFVLCGATDSTFEVLWCTDLTTTADQTLCRLVQ